MSFGIWQIVAQGVATTIQLTVVGFAIGAVLGIPLLMIRTSPIPVLRWIGRGYIEVLRGVPLIIWLFLIYNGPTQFDPALGSVFTSWRSAVIALGLVSAAYMAEIYRGSLKAVKQGQYEASYALGMSRVDTATRVIGPQMIRVAVPSSMSYAITLLKDSSLASTIGVFEITYYAGLESSVASSVTPFFVAGVYYLAITLPSAWAARRLETWMTRGVA
jgi:polar amino acid transport system permease protein